MINIVRNMSPNDVIANYYNSMFKSKNYGKRAVYLNPDPEHYHQRIIKIVKEIMLRKGIPLKILDVGCATGYLGAELKKLGNIVYGIEISKEAAKIAKNFLDYVICDNIETMQLPWNDEFFDIIIMSDVIEHLFNPRDVLIKLRRILKKDGIFLITFPNIAHYSIRLMLLRGKWIYKNYGILDYGHIRFFTKDSAIRLINSSGLKVKRIIPWILLPKPFNMFRKIFYKCFDTLFAITYLIIAERK